jgi:hypothetical protein
VIGKSLPVIGRWHLDKSSAAQVAEADAGAQVGNIGGSGNLSDCTGNRVLRTRASGVVPDGHLCIEVSENTSAASEADPPPKELPHVVSGYLLIVGTGRGMRW